VHVLNTLGPVFLIVAAGAGLRRGRLVSADTFGGAAWLCYWVGMPCLLFGAIARAPADLDAFGPTARAVLLATAGLVAAALVAAAAMRVPFAAVGTFVQATFRGNLAFVGLTVVIFAFAGGPNAARAEATAVLSLAPIVVVYNVVAVVVLLVSRHRLDRQAVRPVVRGVVTNPLLLACVLGYLWNTFAQSRGVPLPLVAERTLSLVGGFALPLALLCVGNAVAAAPLTARLAPAAVVALLKTVGGPLLGLAAARLVGAGPMETGIVLILMACPTAVASYVLAEQLDGDTALAAGAVVLSTLASAATLSVVIAGM
jgi:predicted permease